MKLRVLLVDDEKIVRKSLMKLLPWAQYGMEVVGEASDGRAALAYLAEHRADIAFIDLSMPVMDGFELLQRLNMEYPELVKIVLTCHADVKVIQRAILQDITGYLLKTDFEQEDICELMELARQKAVKTRSQAKYTLLAYMTDTQAHAYAGKAGKVIRLTARLLLLCQSAEPGTLPPGDTGVLLPLSNEEAQRCAEDPGQAEAMIDRSLFYAYTPGRRVYRLSPPPENAETQAALGERLLSGDWLMTPEGCRDMQEALVSAAYPAPLLLSVIDRLSARLDRVLEDSERERLAKAHAGALMPSWAAAREAMEVLEMVVSRRMKSQGISQETASAILYVLYLLDKPENLFTGVGEMASAVRFSRSHFSRSFSQMLGVNYKDYAHAVRLRSIRSMMREEHATLSQIARKLGYVNEEYFCKAYNIKDINDMEDSKDAQEE